MWNKSLAVKYSTSKIAVWFDVRLHGFFNHGLTDAPKFLCVPYLLVINGGICSDFWGGKKYCQPATVRCQGSSRCNLYFRVACLPALLAGNLRLHRVGIMPTCPAHGWEHREAMGCVFSSQVELFSRDLWGVVCLWNVCLCGIKMLLLSLRWREKVAILSEHQLHSSECDCTVCKFSKEKHGISVVNEIKGFCYWIDFLNISTS